MQQLAAFIQTPLGGSLLFGLGLIVVLLVGFIFGSLWQRHRGRVKQLIVEANLKEEKVRELQALNQKLAINSRAIKAKELELEMANKRLESLEQAKSKFITVTTHQLRTPLSAIKWTFDMLLNGHLGPINPEQKEFVAKGYQSTERVIAIVNELLRVDKIESESSDYHFAPLQLPELIANIIFEFGSQAESHGIRLAFQPPPRSVPAIEADRDKIRMVLENLIDNAIKYGKRGGTVTVKINDERVNTAEGQLEIIVADEGIGIAPTDQQKIFQKFFRAANAVQSVPEGSGLGLFIARDIVEKHGGSLWFESVVGRGTVFHLLLPLRRKLVL